MGKTKIYYNTKKICSHSIPKIQEKYALIVFLKHVHVLYTQGMLNLRIFTLFKSKQKIRIFNQTFKLKFHYKTNPKYNKFEAGSTACASLS